MNKVIGGKRYDTEKAKASGYWDNGLEYRDFAYYGETLYVKRTGEFFIYREGGPMSVMSQPEGTGFRGGEGILPLTYDEAKAWAEEKLDANGYSELFGEPDDGTQSLYISSISNTAKSNLEREAAKRGCTQAKIVEELLEAL